MDHDRNDRWDLSAGVHALREEEAVLKLAASMIVRGEGDRYLKPAIEHLLSFCHEVRVIDDGSPAEDLKWMDAQENVFWISNPGPSFFEHEGRARQQLLEWTLASHPDYVLSIDADEFVGDPNMVEKACAQGAPVYTLQMEEVWRADQHLHIRVDHAWRPRPCPILWRAPSSTDSDVWKIPDVQLACGREPVAVRRTRAVASGASVFHFGWACEADRIERAQRYFEHDGGKFHKDAHLQSILWPDELVRLTRVQWPAGLANPRPEIVERASRGLPRVAA